MALGMMIKPIVLALGLYLLLRGRWKALGMVLVTVAIAAGATALLLGPELFNEFIHRQGIGENYQAAQQINQSISGMLLRWQGGVQSASSLFSSPIVLGTIAIVVALTAAVIWFSRHRYEANGLGATLAMSLLIYPASLTHYSVLLLPPLMWQLSQAKDSQARLRAVVVIALVFTLTALKYTFFASLLTWLAMSWPVIMPATRITSAEPTETIA